MVLARGVVGRHAARSADDRRGEPLPPALPRLKCTFAEFVEIIRAFGFESIRHDGGSHQRWRGLVGGEVRFVDLAPHSMKDDIPIGTLNQMIRQSGLPKRLFRK